MTWKEWADNQVLYAADLNEMQKQTVFLGTSIANLNTQLSGKLRAGMMGYVPELGPVFYDGSYWCPSPGKAMASLVATSAQTLATGTWAAITMTNANLNELSAWSSGTRYTAQIPGWYEVHGGVSFAQNATGRRMVRIDKNAGLVPGGSSAQVAVSGGTMKTNVSVFVSMNVGDYVEVYAYQDSGGSLATNPGAGADFYPNMFVKYLGSL